MSVLGEYSSLRASDHAHDQHLAASIQAVDWDSVAAWEAVARTCREATVRCQQVIAAYTPEAISNRER